MADPGAGDLPPGTASRPFMPGYGIRAAEAGRGLLPWSHVVSLMTRARNYWVATVSPGGHPHVVPVWGLWTDDRFFFATEPRSQKARNLEANPAIAVHLESGDEVVVIEGTASRLHEGRLPDELNARYSAKYGVRLEGNPVYQVAVRKAFAWSEADFPASATRWEFGG